MERQLAFAAFAYRAELAFGVAIEDAAASGARPLAELGAELGADPEEPAAFVGVIEDAFAADHKAAAAV